MVDQAVVEVLSTQMCVACCGLYLEDTRVDGQQGNIKSASAQVKDEDVLLARVPLGLLVQAVGNGGSGGLVDDAQHVEPGDGAGILGGLPLGVIEVRRDSDDRLADGAVSSDVLLSDLLHLDQDHGRDLLRGEGLVLALELDCRGRREGCGVSILIFRQRRFTI